MKILFIGGTKFVGRQMVEDAIRKGYDVCLLQRGQTNPDLFPKVKRYVGDRFQIDQIIPQSETFDAVVDTCGYHPEVVRRSAEFLKGKSQLYVFISTASVYADFSLPGLNEKSKIGEISVIPPVEAPRNFKTYGPLKAQCERQIIEIFGENHSLILRPTIIVGPHDDTNRFSFWIQSIMNQKQIEIPSDNEAHIQFIDVHVLSQFTLESIEKFRVGIYNIVGPQAPLKFRQFIETVRNLLNPSAKINSIAPGSDQTFPMFSNQSDWKGFFAINAEKAYRDGLKDIPLEETILKIADFLKAQKIQ